VRDPKNENTAVISGVMLFAAMSVTAALVVAVIRVGGWWDALFVPGILSFALVSVVCWKMLWIDFDLANGRPR
jgi:hypothetical protein